MAQLVQGPSARGLPEQRLGAPVAEPTPTGLRAAIHRRRRPGRDRMPVGQEQRPTGTAANQPRQQPGRTALKVQSVGVAALGADPHALVVQVKILDVDRQGLAGPGGRLIQQAPQRLLPHGEVLAPPSRSSSGNGMALVRPAGCGRRSKSTVRSSTSQRRRRQNARNERTVATWRFQVAGARPPQAVVTATVIASTVSIDSGRSPPSSRTSRVRVWA